MMSNIIPKTSKSTILLNIVSSTILVVTALFEYVKQLPWIVVACIIMLYVMLLASEFFYYHTCKHLEQAMRGWRIALDQWELLMKNDKNETGSKFKNSGNTN